MKTSVSVCGNSEKIGKFILWIFLWWSEIGNRGWIGHDVSTVLKINGCMHDIELAE